MTFRSAKRSLALLGCAFLISSCGLMGDSAAEAKSTLVDALRNLLETKSYTSTYTLESDVDSLVALGEGNLSEEAATKILDSTVEASGVQAENPEESSSQLLVNVAGTDSLEMRFVEGDLYFRAEVRELIELFGGDAAELDAIIGQVAGQPGFEWVEPAVAGEWIVLRDALALSQQMGGMSVTPGQQEELINDLLQTVEQNATVSDEGEDDAGQHLRASLPLQETMQDLIQSLGPAAGMMQGDQGMLSDIPDEDIVIDFWVQDDTVSQLGIDFTQFEGMEDGSGKEFPEGVEELTLLVAIAEADVTVEPIDDAIELDSTALTQALSGLMTGGAGGAGGGGFDCNQLKGAPPEVVELYAEECPELQK